MKTVHVKTNALIWGTRSAQRISGQKTGMEEGVERILLRGVGLLWDQGLGSYGESGKDAQVGSFLRFY